MPPIVCIVGQSASGKTTLIEKLIPELNNRGHRVGTIKHAHHGFDINEKGKDSSRHKAAGAKTVIVASNTHISMQSDMTQPTIEKMVSLFHNVDLVLVEGYKRSNQPKIEVLRKAAHEKPVCLEEPSLIAMITDIDFEMKVPKFDLNDIQAIATFIEKKFL
jgi:molybdopterin-guanine dinucleotide biosynthesis protein B